VVVKVVHIIRVSQSLIEGELQELVAAVVVVYNPHQDLLLTQMHHNQRREVMEVAESLLLLIKLGQLVVQKQLVVLLVSIMEKPFILLFNLEHSPQMQDLMKL
tara:strand:- start:323 stop:631 length:309 start_codon:yes stop_codon:yes gene_type:complete